VVGALVVGCGGAAPPPVVPAAPVPAVAPAARVVDESTVVPEGWLGGVREVDVAAPPDVVMGVLGDADAYWFTLARVRALKVVERTETDIVATITQGTAMVNGTYTARMHRVGEGLVVFSLDERFPHSVDAARGFARVAAGVNGGTRLTWFIAFDVGGMTRLLFGARMERAALSTADRVRAEAERRVAGRH
jgi:carbon monoxide dehydrogenase subunit G